VDVVHASNAVLGAVNVSTTCSPRNSPLITVPVSVRTTAAAVCATVAVNWKDVDWPSFQATVSTPVSVSSWLQPEPLASRHDRPLETTPGAARRGSSPVRRPQPVTEFLLTEGRASSRFGCWRCVSGSSPSRPRN
jgi:hypothetical protein